MSACAKFQKQNEIRHYQCALDLLGWGNLSLRTSSRVRPGNRHLFNSGFSAALVLPGRGVIRPSRSSQTHASVKALLVTWLPDLYKPTCCAIQCRFEHAKMVLR
jgi:hypothetical protein